MSWLLITGRSNIVGIWNILGELPTSLDNFLAFLISLISLIAIPLIITRRMMIRRIGWNIT